MMTSRVQKIDRRSKIELGAGDGICKPYPPLDVFA